MECCSVSSFMLNHEYELQLMQLRTSFFFSCLSVSAGYRVKMKTGTLTAVGTRSLFVQNEL